MKRKLPTIKALQAAIRMAVVKVCCKCAESSKKGKMQEPDYTVALSVYLAAELKAKLTDCSCRVGSCFIHQKPKVRFEDGTCEAGDLLLLCRDGGRYNAALFQMKKMNKGGRRVVDNEVQLKLYTDWPCFTFQKNPDGYAYDIFPKTVHSGAQYLLVDENQLLFPISIPNKKMSTQQSDFSHYLKGFLNWQSGRPISSRLPHDTRDDWSRFVWDIIRQLEDESGFTRRNVGIGKNEGHRLNGDFFDYLCEEYQPSVENVVGAGRTLGFLFVDLTSRFEKKENRIEV